LTARPARANESGLGDSKTSAVVEQTADMLEQELAAERLLDEPFGGPSGRKAPPASVL
jgi:hypothetical protein